MKAIFDRLRCRLGFHEGIIRQTLAIQAATVRLRDILDRLEV